MVTNDMFVSFLHCKRKLFLRATGARGKPPDIETVLLDLDRVYRRRALETFLAPFREQDVVHDPPNLDVALKNKGPVVVNATASANGLSSLIHAAERMKEKSQRDAFVYSPVLFIPNETVSRADKLLLGFNALALSSIQSVLPSIGKIIHGKSYRVLKCNIDPLSAEVRQLVAQIQAAQAEGTAAPRVILNRHCNSCEFRVDCQRMAEEANDLSLLRGMSEQEIEKQRRRGVTTVTQFAYTYRSGRRGKRRTGKARKHDHALQAVALRDNKVYVLDSPTVPCSRTALYLDIEGVPDRGFDYLIGLIAVVDGCATAYSFWADDDTQEKVIWDACKRVIISFEDYTLYHYGQYELRFLDRMRRLADEEGAAAIDHIRARSCNVLATIYSHIYFPTRSNGLKDITNFLGGTWTTAYASGIQSLAWRLAWETNADEALKQHLLLYNLEDCMALRRVTEFVQSVCNGSAKQTDGGKPNVGSASDLQSLGGSHFRRTKLFSPEMEHINKCAYADYQREKVYFRTSPAVRRSLRRKERARKKNLKVNQEIKLPWPSICPDCGGTEIRKEQGRYRKVVTDLKFTASGIKRWIVCYSTGRYRCLKCSKPVLAAGYREMKFHLGRDLCSWAVYHHVALRQSGQDIAFGLNDLFGFSFERNLLTQITPLVAKQLQTTYERLKDKLRHGALIHADETKGVIKGHSGYVWVFTNLEEVVYAYSPTREGNILSDLLDGFCGVLVSDFYSVYDTAKCAQQKCIIHLMRDINDDIFHNPFDEEVKQLGQGLVAILKPIIDTIDRFGLKQQYLNKHKEDVSRYFHYLSAQTFTSEAALKYQRRLQKYKERLFVFLDHDGVPWNNNNAENAIKPFAFRRKILQASFSERGLRDYLVFLSISQTCRNKHLNFLQFLRSGKPDIDAFADGPAR